MDNLIDAIIGLTYAINSTSSTNWSEWTLVVITAIYVVATILICIFNYRSAKATREQVCEQKRQFDLVNRPNIDVTFELVNNSLMCLKIKNTGKKMAQKVKLTANEDFIKCLHEHDLECRLAFEKINDSTFSLGIGQEWYVPIGGLINRQKIEKVMLVVKISYSDDQQTYCGHTNIDFSQYCWAITYKSALDDICKHQAKISENTTKELGLLTKAVRIIEQSLLLKK